MPTRVASLFDIQPGEERLVVLMFLHSVFMGGANVFVTTVAGALFLASFSSQDIPQTYIAAAAVIILLGLALSRLQGRAPFGTLLIGLTGLLFLTTLFFQLGLWFTAARWLPFGLMVWVTLIYRLHSYEYWALAGDVFTLRQGKRLFGLVGSGELGARILGYGLVPLLVGWLGTTNLLALAVACLGLNLLLVATITRGYVGQRPFSPTPTAADKRAAVSLRDRYSLLILAATFLTILLYHLIDFSFFQQIQTRFQNADAIAEFIGIVFATIYSAAFLFKLLLSGRVLHRFGIRPAMLLLPIALGLSALGILAANNMGMVALVFWLAMGARLLESTLRNGIYNPAALLLYQPLPGHKRTALQAAADNIAGPLAMGVAGVGLLLLNRLQFSGAIIAAAVTLFVSITLIAVVIVSYRHYVLNLSQAMAKRLVEGTALSLHDQQTVALVHERLNSPYPAEVLYALRLLEQAEQPLDETRWRALLRHDHPMVRRQALLHVETQQLFALLPHVQQMAATDADVRVRATVLQVLCALDDPANISQMLPYLDDPEPQIRVGALVGLLRSGGIEGVLVAGQALLQMTTAVSPHERALAAEILGTVGVRNFYQPLLTLLDDDDPLVRAAAAEAAAKLKNPALWPTLLAALDDKKVRTTAVKALVAAGDDAVSTLIAALHDTRDDAVRVRLLAQICGRIRSSQAISALKGLMDHPHLATREKVLWALSRCGYTAAPPERETIVQQLRAETALTTWLLAAKVDLGPAAAEWLTFAALGEAITTARRRIFYLLSFLYDAQTMLRARNDLAQPSAHRRAFAIEALDVTLAPPLREWILPLVQATTDEAPPRRLVTTFPQEQLSPPARLKAILQAPDDGVTEWMQACALYDYLQHENGTGRSNGMAALLHTFRQHAHPILRETAVWGAARTGANSQSSGAGPMLLTIEKVLILKTIDTFSQIPDEILAELAQRLEELTVAAGKTIFAKGDFGDSMYIIVEGEVRVHDDARTLNHLGARDVFGEMAILDPAPRVASITAVAETTLLRLNQHLLYELMDDHIEVAQGIIRVLSRHLRHRVRDIDRLRTELESHDA